MKIVSSEPLFPLLALTDIVVFPHTIVPLFIENPHTARLVATAHEEGGEILVSCRRDDAAPGDKSPAIHSVGVSCTVLQLLKIPEGQVKIFIEGRTRRSIKSVHQLDEGLFASTDPFMDFVVDEREAEALRRLVIEAFKEYAGLASLDLRSGQIERLEIQEDPAVVSDIVASCVTMKSSGSRRFSRTITWNPVSRGFTSFSRPRSRSRASSRTSGGAPALGHRHPPGGRAPRRRHPAPLMGCRRSRTRPPCSNDRSWQRTCRPTRGRRPSGRYGASG